MNQKESAHKSHMFVNQKESAHKSHVCESERIGS